jgi:SAM-dependent methyltransferase
MSYDKAFTDALQFVWDAGFLSPGGAGAVAALLNGQDISGARVLDIGSGLGGMDHLLVLTHGAAHVTGIDVDAWLVDQSRDLAAAQGLGDRIKFVLVQPGPLPFGHGAFDVVVSKDAMIHIPDKAAIYGEVMRILAPGGRFLASDWLFGPGAATSPEIMAWLGDNPLGFAFTTPDEALAALRGAGFADPSVTSDSAAVEAIFVAELARLKSFPPDELVRLLGPQQATERVEGAAERLAAVRPGHLRPCLLRGRKAA